MGARHRNEVIRAVEHAPFPLFLPSLAASLACCSMRVCKKILLKFWSHDASGEGAIEGSESVRLASAKSIFSFFVRLRFEPHKRRANSATPPLPHSCVLPQPLRPGTILSRVIALSHRWSPRASLCSLRHHSLPLYFLPLIQGAESSRAMSFGDNSLSNHPPFVA